MRPIAALILLAVGLFAGLAAARFTAAQDGIPVPTPPVGYLGGREEVTTDPGANQTDQTAPTPPGCPTVTEDQNELVVRRWFEEALNQGNLAVLDELLDSGYVHHSPLGPTHVGVESHRRFVEALRAGFPDLNVAVHDVITEGDIVVARWTATGTHLGPFDGVGPTGRSATWTGLNFVRMVCGRMAETWSESDSRNRMEQLGILTPDELASVATPAS